MENYMLDLIENGELPLKVIREMAHDRNAHPLVREAAIKAILDFEAPYDMAIETQNILQELENPNR